MKCKVLITLGLIVLGVVAFGIDAATAQTTANGPYYATPSWDQKLQCDTLATCPRFVVLANWNSAAVLDRETGLVWEKMPSTVEFRWLGALQYCTTLPLGGRYGWRLPTIHELSSLMDSTQSEPALPFGHPFAILFVDYWSATTYLDFLDLAWKFRLLGGIEPGFKTDTTTRAWCVRGGQGVEPK